MEKVVDQIKFTINLLDPKVQDFNFPLGSSLPGYDLSASDDPKKSYEAQLWNKDILKEDVIVASKSISYDQMKVHRRMEVGLSDQIRRENRNKELNDEYHQLIVQEMSHYLYRSYGSCFNCMFCVRDDTFHNYAHIEWVNPEDKRKFYENL